MKKRRDAFQLPISYEDYYYYYWVFYRRSHGKGDSTVRRGWTSIRMSFIAPSAGADNNNNRAQFEVKGWEPVGSGSLPPKG